MRIALCISGMMRTYQKCFPTVIEHIIQANPQDSFDTFIATWDVHGRNPVWWEISKDNTPVDFNHLQEEFGQKLNIKRIMIERFENSDFMYQADLQINTKYANRTGERSNPHNYLPMIYKIDQVQTLALDHQIKNKFNYDVIVRMRSDLFFEAPVHFTKTDIDDRSIFMPERECWGPANLNDQFAYGNSHIMDVYTNQLAMLDQVYELVNSLHPETQLAGLFQICNLKAVKQDIKYRIER